MILNVEVSILVIQVGWEVRRRYKTYTEYLMPTYFPPTLYTDGVLGISLCA